MMRMLKTVKLHIFLFECAFYDNFDLNNAKRYIMKQLFCLGKVIFWHSDILGGDKISNIKGFMFYHMFKNAKWFSQNVLFLTISLGKNPTILRFSIWLEICGGGGKSAFKSCESRQGDVYKGQSLELSYSLFNFTRCKDCHICWWFIGVHFGELNPGSDHKGKE